MEFQTLLTVVHLQFIGLYQRNSCSMKFHTSRSRYLWSQLFHLRLFFYDWFGDKTVSLGCRPTDDRRTELTKHRRMFFCICLRPRSRLNGRLYLTVSPHLLSRHVRDRAHRATTCGWHSHCSYVRPGPYERCGCNFLLLSKTKRFSAVNSPFFTVERIRKHS